MYIRKLTTKGKLTRAQACKELDAVHSCAHHYTCSSCHSEEDKPLARRYTEQEKRLTVMLLDQNRHLYEKLAAKYLIDYPEVWQD